jgi:hypothetical protein
MRILTDCVPMGRIVEIGSNVVWIVRVTSSTAAWIVRPNALRMRAMIAVLAIWIGAVMASIGVWIEEDVRSTVDSIGARLGAIESADPRREAGYAARSSESGVRALGL